jgi:hypothetical protein
MKVEMQFFAYFFSASAKKVRREINLGIVLSFLALPQKMKQKKSSARKNNLPFFGLNLKF